MNLVDTAPASEAELDRRIVLATQGGLPLVPRPYAAVAERVASDEATVRARLLAMLADGRIRRMGAVPNHYAIGYTANGMSVWDVDDSVVDAVGERVRLIYNGKDRGEYIVVGVQFVPEIDATCGIFACAISFNLTEGTIRYRERVKDVVV